MSEKKPTYEELEREVAELRAELERNRARAESAEHLARRLELLDKVMEQTGEGIAVVDMDGDIQFINRAFAAMHQYDPWELIGRNLSIFHTERQLQEEVLGFNEIVREKGFCSGEVSHVRRDGAEFPTHMTSTLLRDEEGRPVGMIGVMADISRLKKAQSMLQEQEVVFTSLMTSMTEHVVYHDTDLSVRWANNAAAASLGLKPEELEGKTCHEMWHGSAEPCRNCPVLRARDTGEPAQMEMSGPDGRHWFIRGYPVHDALGRVNGMVEFTLEITDRINFEQALKQSEYLYRSTIDAMDDILHVVDADLNIVLHNRAMMEINRSLGLPDDVSGKNVFDVYPFLPGATREEYLHVLETGEPLMSEEISELAGREIITETRKIPIMENERTVRIVTMVRDITERKRAEEELRKERATLEDIINLNPYAISLFDKNGRYLTSNQAHQDLMGELPNEDYVIFDDPIVVEKIPPEYIQRLKSGESVTAPGIWYNAHKIAPRFPDRDLCLRTTAFPVFDDRGEIDCFVLMYEDTTERMKAQEDLRRSEERYRSLAESAQDAIFIINNQFRVEYINEAASRMLGKNIEETFHTPLEKLFPPDTVQYMKKDITAVFDTGHAHYSENHIPFGEAGIWLGTQLVPLRDETEGRVHAVLGMSRDITERRQTEEAMHDVLSRFESVLENTPLVAVQGFDRQGVVRHWNQACETLYGIPAAHAVGRTIQKLLLKSDEVPEFDATIEEIWRTRRASEPREWELKTQSGARCWVYSSMFPVMLHGEVDEIFCMDVDITERRLAEEALRDANERLEATINALPDLLFILDYEGRFLEYYSPAGTSLFLPPDVFMDRQVDEMLPPDVATLIMDAIHRVQKTGEKATVEYMLEIPQQGEAHFEAILSPMGEAGRPGSGIVALVRDITERKKLEQAKINFLGSISHELRTPLSLILGYSEMLLKENLPHNVRRKLNIINERGRQELKLVEELITLAKFESGETRYDMQDELFMPFLERHLSEARVMVENLVAKRFRTADFVFNKEIDPALKGAVVSCDPQRIRQVLDNLIENAVKYSPRERLEFKVTAALQDQHIVLGVHDRGVGIDATDRDIIFKPFYQVRTGRHPLSDGMGKGLSIVKDFVLAHNGRVWLDSEPGRGSTFFFSLPIKEFVDEEESQAVRKILVVDDDHDFVDFVESLLLSEGFEVVTAADEDQTYARLEEWRPDLILLDIQLPGGNGMDICYRLKHDRNLSDVYIYFLSAKMPAELSVITKEVGADGFFSKPFEIDSFLDTIENLSK